MFCTLAKLEEEKLAEVRSLEEKLGRRLIAFSCSNVEIVPLKQEELAEIKQAEERLNLSLVAVR